MDKRIQIWNIFHDGEITALSNEDENTVIIFVSIPYLRRRLKPLGDSFVVILSDTKRIDFTSFDGATTTSLLEELEISAPEILSTDSESMPITIATTAGYITLDFQSIRFALDTGQAIEYEEIEKACNEYWTEWRERIPSKNK
jgi:hypothetical protein